MEPRPPQPFAEAIAELESRRVTPSPFRTAEWREVPAAIRRRAFFSAGVENARLLQTMRDYLGAFLMGSRMENGGLVAQGRAEFVATARELAREEGLGRVDPDTGEISPEIRENDLRDIRSLRRLQLIFDTQTEAAQEWGAWRQGMTPAILRAFPASRFIRIRPVMVPRPYHAANEGQVRLKTDRAFWLDMNRDFGVPWGPWGFNSGMGTEDVDRLEAVELGILQPGQDPTTAAAGQDFNSGLAASAETIDPDIAAAMPARYGARPNGLGLFVLSLVSSALQGAMDAATDTDTANPETV